MIPPNIHAPKSPTGTYDTQAPPGPIDPSRIPETGELVLPDIEDAATLTTADLPKPPVLIDKILHAGSKMVIGGGSKSFKTWALADLAISVACGTPWWGQETSRTRVLYINLEIQPAFFAERLKKVLSARGLTLNREELSVWNLRGHAAGIERLIPRILSEVSKQSYRLIILDPIYKCLGSRDENRAGDIGSMMNQLEWLAVKSEAAVVFGAHFSKGNQSAKESMDRIGGSGVFARDPDSIVVLTRHKEENAFAVEATLRNFAPIKPFCVR
jgi:regulatory protein RepA